MRRLTHVLFTLCSATSLMLCVGALGLWAASYPGHVLHRDTLGVDGRTRRDVQLVAWDGCLLLEGLWLGPIAPAAVEGTRPVASRWAHGRVNPGDWTGGPTAPVDGYVTGWDEGGPLAYARRTLRGVVVHLWLVAAVAAVLPALWAQRHSERRRRGHRGACASCGYDLRATPGRCPECGTAAI